MAASAAARLLTESASLLAAASAAMAALAAPDAASIALVTSFRTLMYSWRRASGCFSKSWWEQNRHGCISRSCLLVRDMAPTGSLVHL